MIVLEKKSPYQIKDVNISPYKQKEYFYTDATFNINSTGAIEIGKGTYINENALIIAEKEVQIGRNCKISWDVIIMDTDLPGEKPKAFEHTPVVIEDNVSIGSNCVIEKEVTIGEGSIIAAGSVVTEDVPAQCIYGGSPAKYLGEVKPKESSKSFI